jgi:PAS domain S-box-containing protein
MPIGFAIALVGIVVGVLVLTLRKQDIPGGKSLNIFSITLIVWAFAYGILLNSAFHSPHANGRFWLALITLASTVTATSLLTFVLAYTNHVEWLGKWGILLFCLEPAVTQVLFWSNSGLFSNAYLLTNMGIFLNPSPWYWINAAYSDGLVILAILILVQALINKPRQYLVQSLSLVIAACIPILITIMVFVAFTFILNLEPPLISYIITGGLLFLSVRRFKLFNLLPIPRDKVIETLNDGCMVLDAHNRIVDLNPAAETLLGVKREQTFGQPAENILQNWPKLDRESSLRELETKGSVRIQGELHYLSVRVLPLNQPPDQHLGKVILWRDISERRKADDARQRVRDEVFVLLHTISDTAFRTLNLNDFLTEAITQIVYSFHAQSGLIYLLEGMRSDLDIPKLYLAAHHGIGREDVEKLSTSPEVARMLLQALDQKEAFFIADVQTAVSVPPVVQGLGIQSLLMLPLLTGEQVVGVIGLTRKEDDPAFGNAEISRLAVVSDELGSFIRSDRKRQQAIAQEERQSLVRDLHDSITQKLYGLVAQTEAAQAGLETGSTVDAAVLSKIGESARQALKEMRLFLFQMKPVDLETKGLVGALNERLAAVEGRANIKARVLADEDIVMPLDKESIFYNIALEALNNILKHANASTVDIFLKKRKRSVTLEVADNGRGFDPKNPGSGGMGLRYMHERISKVEGKLVVQSAPGKGTRIIATIFDKKIPDAA